MGDGSSRYVFLLAVIVFSNDIEADGFTILSATTTTLTINDPTNLMPSGSQTTWIIKNYRKDEYFQLENYTILYDVFGESHVAYNIGDGGENSG